MPPDWRLFHVRRSTGKRLFFEVPFIVTAVALSGPSVPRFSTVARSVVVLALWFALIPSFLLPIYFRFRTGSWSLDRGLLSPDPYAKINSHLVCRSFDLGNANIKRIEQLRASGNKSAEILKCYLVKRGYRHQSKHVSASLRGSES